MCKHLGPHVEYETLAHSGRHEAFAQRQCCVHDRETGDHEGEGHDETRPVTHDALVDDLSIEERVCGPNHRVYHDQAEKQDEHRLVWSCEAQDAARRAGRHFRAPDRLVAAHRPHHQSTRGAHQTTNLASVLGLRRIDPLCCARIPGLTSVEFIS